MKKAKEKKEQDPADPMLEALLAAAQPADGSDMDDDDVLFAIGGLLASTIGSRVAKARANGCCGDPAGEYEYLASHFAYQIARVANIEGVPVHRALSGIVDGVKIGLDEVYHDDGRPRWLKPSEEQ